MTEDLIHFIWKYKWATLHDLTLEGDKRVEIISPGEHNYDSGPDFFNAKVRIGETIWAGNVEIHINSSDWNAHGHCNDSAYNSVILHVVVNNDSLVYNSNGELVPTVQIPYPTSVEWDLQRLVSAETWIPCSNKIKSIGEFNIRMWLSSLAVERLEQKTRLVFDLVKEKNGSWEEAFYISMAKSFGLKINALPFELMAKNTPLKVLAKVRSSLISLEAILFGQAGMLDSIVNDDDYVLQLQKEYNYQQAKFGLNPIPAHLWKFMRLRPLSFPTVRLAQFAQLVYQSNALFSKCLEYESFNSLKDMLKVQASSYWETHYTFGSVSNHKIKVIGDETIRVIALNTIVPFMFGYGEARGDESLKERALSILESMKPESNSIVKGFALSGVVADSAFYSQAMVQLKGQYCDKRKCLFCQIGANLLLKKVS